MSPFTPTRLAAFGAATAVVTGTLAAAPVASASVSRISIATAGSKPVNQATYAWGTVTGGAGIRACAQVLVGSTWQTQWAQCVTTGSTGGYSIRLAYNEGAAGTTTWRVLSGGAVSATTKLTRTGASTTPAKPSTGTPDYIKNRTRDGFDLTPSTLLNGGSNGVKVYLVEKSLGLKPGPMDSSLGPVRYYVGNRPVTTTLWSSAVSKIKTFQASKGLRATGVVDANTFYALKDFAPNKAALAAYDFHVDKLIEKPTIAKTAPQPNRAAAMVAWAKTKNRLPYIWGGTGPMGYDCSGLLLQALRAGGVTPADPHVANVTDVQPPSKLSNAMLHDTADFTTLNLNTPTSSLRPGDFIFYGSSLGTAGHVSMYIGGGQVINAVGADVHTMSITNNAGWPMKVGMSRPR